MADENYIDLYKDDESGKVGTVIAGKDVVRLNAPEVLLSPDTPLLTNAQDVAGAINELFRSGGEGGDGQDVYIVNGSSSSITVQTVSGRNSGSPSVKTYVFYFTSRNFYKSTTITGRRTSITRTWSKNIITSVSGSEGMIFTMDVDNSGKITACYDCSGNDILKGETYGSSIFTSTPEGVALGWALAYSNEQNSLMEREMDAYEEGREDNIEASGPEGDPGGDDTEIKEVDFQGGGAYCEYWIGNTHNIEYFAPTGYIQIKPKSRGIWYVNRVQLIKRTNNEGTLYEYDQFFDPPASFTGDAGDGITRWELSGTIVDENFEPWTGPTNF